MVSLEMFNRRDDYLFEGYADGRSSPLCACLNAGWRTGITGVTDEHGVDWGFPEGKGRTGLWVEEHSRAGVLAAMRARRFFATRTSGLRLDATVAPRGVPGSVRMGGVLPISRGMVRFTLDLACDASWTGRPLTVQVLRPGTDVPRVPTSLRSSRGTWCASMSFSTRRTGTGSCCGSATRHRPTPPRGRTATPATTSGSPTPAPGG